MVTTRWTDKKASNLDEALANASGAIYDDGTYVNWHVNKVFPENLFAKMGNRDIEFNLLRVTYDQIAPGKQPIEDRTRSNDLFVIPYYNGVRVSYIINKNTGALTILRKVLHYNSKGELTSSIFESIGSDFFEWIISKVYNSDFIIETGNNDFGDINLEAIKEFKGDTEDLLTKITATGESVINIISTLSFLLESNKLNQIRTVVSCKDHANIELHLLDRGTISIPIQRYAGQYYNDSMELLNTKLHLLVYLEIIPALIQSFQEDNWDKEKSIAFMRKVGNDLRNKIEGRIAALK